MKVKTHVKRRTLAPALLLAACMLMPAAAAAQTTIASQREMGRMMLRNLKSELQKNYYDPAFRGVDLDAHFGEAEERMKAASSTNEILAIVAQALLKFNDSHTLFIPPMRSTRVEHGWQMSPVGDRVYVSAVRPGSDAEAKGLRPGDRVLQLENTLVTRTDLWKLLYIFHVLSPRPAMRVVVQKPDGKRADLQIAGQVYEGSTVINLQTGMASQRDNLIREAQTVARLYRHRYIELGDEALIWRMPQFDLSEQQIDELMEKAKRRKALVLDMRGNGGGEETTLLRLIGHLFDRDVTVGQLKRRKDSRPLVAKTRGANAFKGRVVALVDADSGSAAEVLARVLQLEKRGTVVGDRTSGRVMRSRNHDYQLGSSLVVYYGANITDADLVMSDGKSLENFGVTPDELKLPAASDLAAGLDPVLAHAGALAGIEISPEKAGTLFPVEWRK